MRQFNETFCAFLSLMFYAFVLFIGYSLGVSDGAAFWFYTGTAIPIAFFAFLLGGHFGQISNSAKSKCPDVRQFAGSGAICGLVGTVYFAATDDEKLDWALTGSVVTASSIMFFSREFVSGRFTGGCILAVLNYALAVLVYFAARIGVFYLPLIAGIMVPTASLLGFATMDYWP